MSAKKRCNTSPSSSKSLRPRCWARAASTRCSSASRSASTWSTSAPTSRASCSVPKSCLHHAEQHACRSSPAAPPTTACSRSKTSNASRRAPRHPACRSTTATSTRSRRPTSISWSPTCAPACRRDIPLHGTLGPGTPAHPGRSPGRQRCARRQLGARVDRRRHGVMTDQRDPQDHHLAFDVADGHTLAGYLRTGGYRRLARRVGQDAGAGARRRQERVAARPWWRRVPRRHQVGVGSGQCVAPLHGHQR